ncbi:hypothetical protein ASPZODRAFT_99785 [Penicilliopsis zonata CBS 506.65]|uniref:Uncharacterized protein n=1 Tax=Penicilliopsis zonata CBS 506.65 TaxID=1073090 RepID=A0A1L9SCJ5_9EURO|nr:hypothetical protein ASPZODRAFT_99785 [Penicilliopsis zonata CBS 506.65]OJJ44849.1 hypothetical protein ASPZODRAFT_99785 [Penicilliopsis zonata CBS 506.65]
MNTPTENVPVSQDKTAKTSQQIDQEPVNKIFDKLRAYPFTSDAEFANGLSTILGHQGTPATAAEINRDDDLILQAKCFFFARKERLSQPLNFVAYKEWLKERQMGETPEIPPLGETSQSAETADSEQQPVYPSSFSHIVDLITSGQPIPGIQQIPDTVLTGHTSSSSTPKRRKPWEMEPNPSSGESTGL